MTNLSPTDDDLTLGGAVQRAPHLLVQAQTEASRNYARACALLNEKTTDHVGPWNVARQRTAAAMVRPATWRTPQDDLPGLAIQFRAALEAGAFYAALAALTPAETAAAVSPHGQLFTYVEGLVVAARHPALQAWVKQRDAAQQRAAEADAAQRAAVAAAELAARPAGILAALRARGVSIGLDAKLNITASTPGGLTDAEVAELKAHKPAIVALIHAETAAQMVTV